MPTALERAGHFSQSFEMYNAFNHAQFNDVDAAARCDNATEFRGHSRKSPPHPFGDEV